MKPLPTLLLTLVTAGYALAAPPEIHRPDRYKELYLNSMFTDPPPEEIKDIIPSDLPDWGPVGVSKYVGGVEVNIMNIKDRTRVSIPSKEATEMGFSIEEVKQGGNYIDDTVVTLKKGGDSGEVRFDPKFLVLKKIAGPSVAKGQAPPNPSASNGRSDGKPPTPPTPPTPGSPSSSKTGNQSVTPPRPGSSRGSNVPRPSSSTTGKSSSRSGGRVRYIPKK